MSSNQTVTAVPAVPTALVDAAVAAFGKAANEVVGAVNADPMIAGVVFLESYNKMPTAEQVASDAVDAAGAWLSPESDKETQQQAGKTALVVGLGVAMAAFGWAAWKVANVKTDETGKK
jgi:hypothetical protein